MKRMFSRALAGAGLLTLALAAPSFAQDTIKIGVIADKTGTAKFYSEPVMKGIELAVKEINGQGGVLGKKIELLVEDDQNLPELAATKARKLIDDGAVFIIGNSSSTTTQQSQNVTMAAKMPHMTPTNSADTLTTTLNNPYFWQTAPLGATQIQTLMAFAKAKAYKRVALISDNTDLSQLIARFFKQGLVANGAEVVVEEVMQRGATTILPNMQKVRAANPEAIFTAAILGAENVLFFKAYHQLGMKQPILGSYNLSIPGYMTTAKDLMEGVAFVDAYDSDKPEARAFIAKYQKEYGVVPFSLPAYGYDGVFLIADVIKRAGSTDKEKIRAAMQATTNFASVTGAKGCKIGFKDGKRTGFDPNCAVVRVVENNTHGRVVHVGVK
ncbi:MAG: ABC transporter substrate-binding protein [Alphaproteobacteria bacterium]